MSMSPIVVLIHPKIIWYCEINQTLILEIQIRIALEQNNDHFKNINLHNTNMLVLNDYHWTRNNIY